MSSFQPQIPASIGRYKILRLLGSGAMGDVYLAADPHIDRQLAIKTVRVLGGTELDIAERKQRLLREARAAGKLLHPNVVALFDADEVDGVLYLAFEFVDGVDLAQRSISAPPLTLRQVLSIVQEVATALDYAHRFDIVHRDIKPSNILLGPGGEAKVADFGIAKLHGSTELTRTGSVVGSPQYMSPEQVRGEALDGRSDLFSVGVVLYELLCRMRPFTGDTISTLVFEILAKEPPTVDQLRPGLPAKLVSLVHRLLAKDRQHRPATGGDVVGEIATIVADTPAHLLDGPAAPPSNSEGATIRMPSSGGVVPPPPPIPTGASSPAPRPTATMSPATPPSASFHPPTGSAVQPPPPAPPGTAPQHAAVKAAYAPPSTAPPAPAPAAPVRSTPLDSGLHRRSGGGSKLFIGLAAFILVAGLGFFAARFLMPSSAETPDAQPGTPVAEGAGDAGESEGGPAAQREAESDGVGGELPTSEPATAEPTRESATPEPTRESATSEPSPSETTTSESTPSSRPAATPPRSSPPPPRVTPPPPSAPASQDPAPQSPTTDRQTTRATTSSEQEIPPPSSAPAASEGEAETRFDRLARGAYREMRTGTRFRFDVEPENTLVKIQARGERSIVQGQVSRFEAGEEDARDLELPGEGDFLITLVHPGYPDVVYFVHADAGTSAQTIQLSMAAAAREGRQAGGSESIRVSRGVSFSGNPTDAVVYVDGERRGLASEWPGGGRGLRRARNTLKLDRGRHKLRLEAPGFAPHEVEVIVESSARQRTLQIVYRLERNE